MTRECRSVKVVRLSPMTVASCYGFGQSPELTAWSSLLDWSKQQQLDLSKQRFFGFDNPGPTPGSPNYGYEQWVSVPAGTKGSCDVEIKTFEGGLYATIECKLQHISTAWKQLVLWCEDSEYNMAGGQCLEEALSEGRAPDPETMFVLFQPIAE